MEGKSHKVFSQQIQGKPADRCRSLPGTEADNDLSEPGTEKQPGSEEKGENKSKRSSNVRSVSSPNRAIKGGGKRSAPPGVYNIFIPSSSSIPESREGADASKPRGAHVQTHQATGRKGAKRRAIASETGWDPAQSQRGQASQTQVPDALAEAGGEEGHPKAIRHKTLGGVPLHPSARERRRQAGLWRLQQSQPKIGHEREKDTEKVIRKLSRGLQECSPSNASSASPPSNAPSPAHGSAGSQGRRLHSVPSWLG